MFLVILGYYEVLNTNQESINLISFISMDVLINMKI